MPAQEAPVSGDRDQQDADPEPDLHPAGEPGRAPGRAAAGAMYLARPANLLIASAV
jgi:hypothetical protein